jgi:hypothetical protein
MARDEVAAGKLTVVHGVPGRMRLRLPHPARADGLVEAVSAVAGVRSAAWAPRTRSLLVLYDAGATAAGAIVDAVAEHAGLEATPLPPADGARPTLARAITTLAREVDARVTRASRGILTLGTFVPLALTAWAAREVLRGRTAPLAWSTALWYAHGLFRDYNAASPADIPSHDG